MCRRWKNSFENFLEDMGERPSKDYSIDRINNNSGYSKGNCNWVTKKTQANNRRPGHLHRERNNKGRFV